jgi:Asp-tRNA(Asn)/Glu-tRNA(Gln) amidotransferase A subunit family amidase
MVERTLAAIEAHEPALHALLDEPERAYRLHNEAATLGDRWPDPAERLSLYGLPFGVKDLFRVDGLETRAGSALPPDEFLGPEAPAVTRLRAFGAIPAAKTTTDEFAYSEPPPTRNPHDLERTPGGSSAGSAVGVARGMFPFALGTQTSRSIIAPAAFCGIVGFKPSFGRVNIDGVVPLSPSMDTVGILAADTEILTWSAAVLLDDWRPRAASQNHGNQEGMGEPASRLPRFGVPDGLYLDSLPREGWHTPFEGALAALTEAGAVVSRSALPWDADLAEIYHQAMVLLHGEMARVHEEWEPRHGHLYRPRTRNGIEHGRKQTAEGIERARSEGLLLRHRIQAWLDERGIDFLLSPSQPEPAPLLGTRTGWGSTTTPWSFAGLPCGSLPNGMLGGLPVGLQVIGRHGADEDLVSAMRMLESALL